MRNVKLGLSLLLLVPAGLWLLADTLVPRPFTYFSFREVFVQLTGVLAIVAMSAAMVLATRPTWLESHLGGLDKIYRLHKWLGIAALAVSTVHWWWAYGTKLMVGWGWLERPQHGPGPGGPTAAGIEAWLRGQRGLAENVGEWAFYAAAILLVLALVPRFPYHLFKKVHVWLAAVFLALVYHALVLTRFSYWSQPIGWLLAVLLVAGTVSAILALLGRIGAGRKVQGAVEDLVHYPSLQVLETSIRLDEGWRGHEPGQFAFVTSDRNEGAHPYTIASAWDPAERRIVFITKALGDHTRRLRDRLKPGLPVTVEGPYGCFTFHDDRPVQIWVGAGIGITPFIARMKHLARHPQPQAIHLFHPTADYEQAAIDKLTADAKAAGVALHVLVSPRDGLLTGDRIRKAVPSWREASLWFCGPVAFGRSLRLDFRHAGLPDKRFHQELFQMR